MDPAKFINIQGDTSKNTLLFLSNFRKKFPNSSSKPSHLTKSSGNLKASHSSNFLTIQNSPQTTNQKPNTYYFKKFLPLVSSQGFEHRNIDTPSSYMSGSRNFAQSMNKEHPSSNVRNESSISRKKFSLVRRSLDVFDVGPHQVYIQEMLSKEFDENIKLFLENKDQESFLMAQKDRFGKLKAVSEYFLKEIEALMGAPLSGKQAFLLDLFKLLEADYAKIIRNFIGLIDLPLTQPPPSHRSDRELKTSKTSNFAKPDLMASFISLLRLLERVYPSEPSNISLMQELIDELQKEIAQLKTSLRMLDYDDRAYIFICSLEGYIKSFFNSTENLRSEVANLTNQIKHYESLHEGNYFLSAKSVTDEMLRKALNTDTFSNRKEEIKERMNDLNIFTERLNWLGTKIQSLTDEIARKDLVISGYEAQVHDLKEILSQKPVKTSKATQATGFYSVGVPAGATTDPNLIVTKLLEKSNVGFKMGFDCGLAVVNLILNDKMIQDHYDMRERGKPQSLQSFVFHWFITKMGNNKLSKLFITDFFSSIIPEKQKRFRIFTDLVGLDSIEISQRQRKQPAKNPTQYFKQQFTKMISTASIVDEKIMTNSTAQAGGSEAPAIKIFCRSPQACKLLIKAAYMLKYSQFNQKSLDKYSPLFPMFDNDLSSYNFELIASVFKQILKDEEFPEEQCEEYCSQLFEDFMNSNDMLRKSGISPSFLDRFKNNIMEKTLINIDYFLNYLLEFFSQKFKEKLDIVLKNFEIVVSNRIYVESPNIDDFRLVFAKTFPKKSQIWCDRVFSRFCMKNAFTSSASFSEMLLNVSQEFLQVDFPYIPFAERALSPEMRPSVDFNSYSEKASKNTPVKKKKIEETKLVRIGTFARLKQEDEEQFKIDNYDVVNDLIVLSEFYGLVSGFIMKEEAKNEGLFINHQLFKKELVKLPGVKLFKTARIYSPILAEFERRDLIEKIEKAWYYFRLMVEALNIEQDSK